MWINYLPRQECTAKPFPRATIRWCNRLCSRRTQAVSIQWRCQTMQLVSPKSRIKLAIRWLRMSAVTAIIHQWDMLRMDPVSLSIQQTSSMDPRQRSQVWIPMRRLVAINWSWQKVALKRKSSRELVLITSIRPQGLSLKHLHLAARHTRLRIPLTSTRSSSASSSNKWPPSQWSSLASQAASKNSRRRKVQSRVIAIVWLKYPI